MNRRTLTLLILADLALMGYGGFRAWERRGQILAERRAAAVPAPTPAEATPAVEPDPETPPPEGVPASTEPVPALSGFEPSPPGEPAPAPEGAPTGQPGLSEPAASAAIPSTAPVVEAQAAPPAPPASTTAQAQPGSAAAKPGLVNKRFQYVDSKAKSVQITGSFTNWKPRPMARVGKSSWAVTFSLAPGEYSYQLIIDGKAYRDPAQPRTDDQGRSLVAISAGKR